MKVFVAAPLPGDATHRLATAAEVTVDEARDGVDGGVFARGAAEWEALVTLLTDRIDGPLLARAPRVRLVANVAVGNTPGVLTEATADFAFGLLLAAARRIAEGDRTVRAGEFLGWAPTLLV